jgi:hypothetical protein
MGCISQNYATDKKLDILPRCRSSNNSSPDWKRRGRRNRNSRKIAGLVEKSFYLCGEKNGYQTKLKGWRRGK